jgi:hypothetical protein
MTQEHKDILLKDLCARLPYGVKAEKYTIRMDGEFVPIANIEIVTAKDILARNECPGYTIKPYLFPLSSMTEEQWIDTPYANLNKFTFDSFKCGCSTLAFETYEVNLSYVVEFINWCYKNHFDIYGLIPMGLAEDATGKNIY